MSSRESAGVPYTATMDVCAIRLYPGFVHYRLEVLDLSRTADSTASRENRDPSTPMGLLAKVACLPTLGA
jgi:hypothetical protein